MTASLQADQFYLLRVTFFRKQVLTFRAHAPKRKRRASALLRDAFGAGFAAL
jgi:hypothetical protein